MTKPSDDSMPHGQLLVARGWVQAAAMVVLFGFFVLGLLAYRTYIAGPPIPEQVVSDDEVAVFSGADVQEGQRIFLRTGLMVTPWDTPVSAYASFHGLRIVGQAEARYAEDGEQSAYGRFTITGADFNVRAS